MTTTKLATTLSLRRWTSCCVVMAAVSFVGGSPVDCFAGVQASSAKYRVVAYSGDPRLPSAAVMLWNPQLDQTGGVTIESRDAGYSNGKLIRVDADGAVAVIASSGDHAPGFGADIITTGFIAPTTLSDNGAWAFGGDTYSGATQEYQGTALWVHRQGTPIQLVTHSGAQPPGLGPDFAFTGFGFPLAVGPAGQVATVGGFMQKSGVPEPLMGQQVFTLDGSSGIRAVATTGQFAPGTTGRFGQDFYGPIVDSQGALTFAASLEQSGQFGIWQNTGPDELHLLALGGLTTVGPLPSDVITGIDPWSLRSAPQGSVSFMGQVNPAAPAGSGPRRAAMLATATGEVTTLIRQGDPLPGSSGHETIAYPGSPKFTDDGQWLAEASFERDGVWAGVALISHGVDTVERVLAMAGDHMAGFGSEATLQYLTAERNNDNRIALFGGMTGPGVDDSNDVALWLGRETGHFRLALREGDDIEVSPGDIRRIETLSWHGRLINDRGEVLAVVRFADGTDGVLIITPEPASWLLAALGIGALLALRGRPQFAH